jgi:cystathionine gamma-synthase
VVTLFVYCLSLTAAGGWVLPSSCRHRGSVRPSVRLSVCLSVCRYEPALSQADALTLLHNSSNLTQRLQTIASNTAALTRFLEAHPLVKTVHYTPTPPSYTGGGGVSGGLDHDSEAAAGGGGGGGGGSLEEEGVVGLISIILEKESAAPFFFDALDVAKGPGFGTNFTLACPYTLLAHYTELDWAADCGVEASLVRVWVGLDPQEHLLQVFGNALDTAAEAAYSR